MELKWKIHRMTILFRTTDGTRCVMDVHEGTYVRYVAVRVDVTFDNLTSLKIGDDGDSGGFGTVTEGSATLQNLTGEYLCTQNDGGPNANGKLYTEDDTIDATFVKSNGPTQGIAEVIVVYAEVE